jgi:hypothetical protein
MAAARKSNPFAVKLHRLPHKAFIRRQGPWRESDLEEIEVACRKAANGADYQFYAGSRRGESGCTVICFDSVEKAQCMQEWIDKTGIAKRPLPAGATGRGLLKFGG